MKTISLNACWNLPTDLLAVSLPSLLVLCRERDRVKIWRKILQSSKDTNQSLKSYYVHGVLPPCVCLVPEKAQKGCQINLLKLELQPLGSCHVGAGNQRPLEEQPGLLKSEPSLPSPSPFCFQYWLLLCAQASLECTLLTIGAHCLANGSTI